MLDNQKQPLMPCSSARARQLLRDGKAAVFRRYPFTIILKDRAGGDTQPLSLNVDPGSKTTGVALVAEYQRGQCAAWALHIGHRGQQIKSVLDGRRGIRRSRRNRKTRCRAPRFLNRTRPRGWLAPSVVSRVHNVETWAKRLTQFAPIVSANVETVRFDTQIMENPNMAGMDYQQGSLFGWELREYLLYRHKHTCAYCDGLAGDAVLEKEHIVPRALGGSNRRANHVISCRTCNEDKGSLYPNAWAQLCSQRSGKLNATRAKKTSVVNGFKTGDMVAASVPTGKKQGVYVGRVAVRSSGSFNVQTKSGVVQGVSHKHCRILQRSDGYNFTYGAAIPLCPKAQSLLAETR
ncbi:RNA-guided endonuclease IscB [Aliidiomarina quisquiliarum]|uniref:RNA-guided endonuclease IscB n=1 Tax=Aliidiomarina quisquiliarum TaxID=2938947 RepID=UPI00208F9D01|nr:RNA-guided endonuclease IscB [Aliidiomarina quisquiliarum]